jgi:hypothetical protein
VFTLVKEIEQSVSYRKEGGIKENQYVKYIFYGACELYDGGLVFFSLSNIGEKASVILV